MTMRIYLEDADGGIDTANYVDVPDFEFGDSRELLRHQSTRKGVGGKHSVYDRGAKNRMIAGLMTGLTHDELLDLEEFFDTQMYQSVNRFYLRIANPRQSSTWNPMGWTWKCDAMIDGSVITCDQSVGGSTVVCDQRIATDYEYVGPCRFTGNGLKWIAIYNGCYTVSLACEIEREGE